MVYGIYGYKISDPNYTDDENQLTLGELRVRHFILNNKRTNENIFGLIETHCFSMGIKAKELVSIKNLNYDRFIFYCLKDIQNGYYEDTNKIDLAIVLYEKREEFLDKLIGIKGGNEIIPNLLYEIKKNIDNPKNEIFKKSLDFLINYHMDILGLRTFVGRY